MPQTLVQNADFWVAALSQTFVSALQLDPDGMYSQVGVGIVEKFSEEYVRLKDSTALSRIMPAILPNSSTIKPHAANRSMLYFPLLAGVLLLGEVNSNWIPHNGPIPLQPARCHFLALLCSL